MPHCFNVSCASRLVLRLVALIKFMKWIPQLAFILDAIVSSVRLLLYTVLLMGMCFYYFAVAGVLLFKDNDHEHFGKLHTSFLSMVSVSVIFLCVLLGHSFPFLNDCECTGGYI